MNLVDRLYRYQGGYLASLEHGYAWGIFIGRFVSVRENETEIEIEIKAADLFTLAGTLVKTIDYTLSWHRKLAIPAVPIETSKSLAFYLPYVEALLIFYLPLEGRPTFATVFNDLMSIRYV